MSRLRWKLSVAIWWLWIKVTPESTLKDVVIQSADLGLRLFTERKP